MPDDCDPANRPSPSCSVLGGAAFERLAPALQRFHRLSGPVRLSGYVEVDAPTTLAARLLARCCGAPTTPSRGPLLLEMSDTVSGAQCTRHIDGRAASSRLCAASGALVQQLGVARLTFALHECGGRLTMTLQRLSVLGIRCPRWLMPQVVAVECGDKRRLRFRIEARMKHFGRLAGYRGWLDLGRVEPMPCARS